MLSIRLVSRGNISQYVATSQRLHTSSLLRESSESSSSDSDKEDTKKSKSKPVPAEQQRLKSNQETLNRLNSLLSKMAESSKTGESLDLSIPPKKPKLPPRDTNQQQSYESMLTNAAKEVATALGGDTKKTESDLLNKLLSTEKNKPEEGDEKKTPDAPLNLNDLIMGMKIDRTPEQPAMPSFIKRKSIQAREAAMKYETENPTKFVHWNRNIVRKNIPGEFSNLYTSKTNIFNNTSMADSTDKNLPSLTTWNILERKEFELALTHPPENIFQEMIVWTKEGKLWKFPIDNEQGMEEERSVHFSEHVFMERHLRDWCPKRGPIRHFMELVCVGLSKNPYMTVKEKQNHIAWYREYFGTKQDLLKELGAIEEEIPLQTKQIQA